jgi:predicted Mrr-cat superfamily restriction endonuclease
MKEELTNHLISVSKNSEDLLNALMENYKKLMKEYLKRTKKLIILNGQNL